MLSARLATAVVLVAAIAGTLIYLPPWAFSALILCAVLFALAELFRLSLSVTRSYRLIAILFGMVVAVHQTWPLARLPIDVVLIVGVWLIAFAYMILMPTLEHYAQRVGAATFGAVYIGMTLPYLSRMREMDHGRAMVAMTLAMVALSDTAAFTVGKTIGRKKLAALISPNKTLEGFIGGFFGSVGGILAVRALWWNELPLLPAIGLGLLIGLVAPIGDLIESAIKRGAHVKDSGDMLPGHGGMLDRCDAYLFSAPVVFYYLKWVVGV